MDLRHLHSFVTVAELLSFKRAAAQLRLSQPPLSRQIKALEEELGVRLLNRSRASQVSLTEAGHSFLEDARLLLNTVREARARAMDAANGKRGWLGMCNVASLSTQVITPLLRAFREQYPEVQVRLLEMTAGEHVAALREGRIHVGIYPDLCMPEDRGFDHKLLSVSPMVAVLPPGHPLAKAEDADIGLDIQALAHDTILVPPPEVVAGYATRLEHVCAVAGFTPKATCPVGGVPNLLGMVAASYGVAILPEMLANAPLPRGQVRWLRRPVPPFQLNLIWLGGSPSPLLRNFLAVADEFAVQAARDRSL